LLRRELSSIKAHLDGKLPIDISYDGNLPGLHVALRNAIGLTRGHEYDITAMLRECLETASIKPPSYYAYVNDLLTKFRGPVRKHDNARPDASWYYLLYLALFMTGDRALVATTLEEDDPKIQKYFEANVRRLREATGFCPLILWMPPSSTQLSCTETGERLRFTEIQPAVFRSNWRKQIEPPDPQSTFFEAADGLLHRFIRFGHVI
jgi:hypothetical protein